MKILSKNINAIYTIKKSKFVCFAFFVKTKEEIQKIFKQIKKEYSDASHVCYAYILDDSQYYYSDGGEPSGCAGKPIYHGLLAYKLNYTLFVIIRYFGGIKFGTSLLRSTFNELTRKTLSTHNFVFAKKCDVIKVWCSFCEIKKLEPVLVRYIYDKKYDKGGVMFYLVGDASQINSLLSKLKIKPTEILNNQIVNIR